MIAVFIVRLSPALIAGETEYFIMKYGKSLQELLTVLRDREKKDFTVDSSNLQYDHKSNQLITLENNEAYKVNNTCMDQIGTKLNIPSKYMDILNTEEHRELLSTNINYWFENSNKQVMVRAFDKYQDQPATARAFLSPRYKVVDHDQICEMVLPRLLDNPEIEIVQSEITEKKLYIKAVNHSMKSEISVGDIVESGITISNSEVGYGSVSITPFIYRLVCSNGLKVNDSKIQAKHLTSSQADRDGVYNLLSDEAKQKDSEALLLKCRDVTESVLSQTVFNDTVDKLREANSVRIEQPKKAIEFISKKFSLNQLEQESVFDRVLNRDDNNNYTSKYSIVNAVTNLANSDQVSFDRADDLQSIGGLILNLPNSELARVA